MPEDILSLLSRSGAHLAPGWQRLPMGRGGVEAASAQLSLGVRRDLARG